MGTLINTFTVDPNQGGRTAGSFQNGRETIRVQVMPRNVIVFLDSNNHAIYTEYALADRDFAILSIDAEIAPDTGLVALVAGGFTANTGNSYDALIRTTYRATLPPVPLQTAPAPIGFGGRLYLFAAGVDPLADTHPLYVRSSADGIAWGDWQALGGNARSTPAPAILNNRLYLFVVGTDPASPLTRPVYYRSTPDGTNWDAWVYLGGNLA